MLSRLAFRNVTATPFILSSGKIRAPTCVVVLRDYASEGETPQVPAHIVKRPPVKVLTVKEMVANWDAANKLYYGPDRDFVNFPTYVQPEKPPPVRLGFVPDSWFQLFYDKTGVTGPYVFGVGAILFLLSKEIWIYDHNMTHFVGFWLAFYFIVKKFGPRIKQYLMKAGDELMERHWFKPIATVKNQMSEQIKNTEDMVWREEGQKYLFQAKRENLDLQLEAHYRQRLAEVGQAVKRRLDYQLDVDNTRRRIHQQHMVQWIVDGVVKGITPQQEKDSLLKCIQDLKSLATQQSPATV